MYKKVLAVKRHTNGNALIYSKIRGQQNIVSKTIINDTTNIIIELSNYQRSFYKQFRKLNSIILVFIHHNMYLGNCVLVNFPVRGSRVR